MLITYLLAALAVIVVVAIVLWMRARNAQPEGRTLPDTNDAKSASGAVVSPRAASPGIASGNNTSDPDATMVHRRAAPTSIAAVPRHREGSLLDDAHLVGLSGCQRGNRFPLVAAGITIGRALNCDIVLTDVRVSQRHAWMGIIDNKAVLRDLKSTNGTFLNTGTQPIDGDVELCAGDTIFFGGHQGDQFRFLVD
jgi:hypothetical protein